MAEELDQRRGSADKVEAKPASSDHKHIFDATVENPADPPARKYCACGHWERIEK